jgi:hypothetical protein
MGLFLSPYQAAQAMGIAEDVIWGDTKDPLNALYWDHVRLNLPGSKAYDPSKPWVSKQRLKDDRIAADLFIFVDDLRPTGPSQKDCCWLAARRAGSKLNFLGIQDTPSKRRDSSKSPGTWAGGVIRTTEEGVVVLTSQENGRKPRLSWKRFDGWLRRTLMTCQESDLSKFEVPSICCSNLHEPDVLLNWFSYDH